MNTELQRELIEAAERLTPAELEGAMMQLEDVMEALPPDVESAADRQIRYGLEVLTTGYRIGSNTDRGITCTE